MCKLTHVLIRSWNHTKPLDGQSMMKTTESRVCCLRPRARGRIPPRPNDVWKTVTVMPLGVAITAGHNADSTARRAIWLPRSHLVRNCSTPSDTPGTSLHVAPLENCDNGLWRDKWVGQCSGCMFITALHGWLHDVYTCLALRHASTKEI